MTQDPIIWACSLIPPFIYWAISTSWNVSPLHDYMSKPA